MSAAGSVDVLIAIGDDDALSIDAFRGNGGQETTVSITIPIDGATISLAFSANRDFFRGEAVQGFIGTGAFDTEQEVENHMALLQRVQEEAIRLEERKEELRKKLEQ